MGRRLRSCDRGGHVRFCAARGQMADIYGKRPMLLRAMFGGAVVVGLMGLANAPWQILVLRGLMGALTGTVAAATVLVATISPKEQIGYTMGMLQTGIYVGASVGPAFGGVLSDLFGHRVTFFATSVLLVAGAIIVMRFVREEPTRNSPAGSFIKSIVPDLGPLARSPNLVVLLLVSGGLQVATNTVAPILPLFIQAISPQTTKVGLMTGLILGGSAVAAAVSSAGLGRVSYRIGYERLLAFCLGRGSPGLSPPGVCPQPDPAPRSTDARRGHDRRLRALHQCHDRHAGGQEPPGHHIRLEHEHELGRGGRRPHGRGRPCRGIRVRLRFLCGDRGPPCSSHRCPHREKDRLPAKDLEPQEIV